MKTLGILGGMGPMATVYLERLIIEMTDAKVDQEHIKMVVISDPSTPDRTKFILGQSTDSPLPSLTSLAKSLMHAGCDILALPCITAHYFHKDLLDMGAPLINGIEETAKYLKEEGVTSVGIMATDGTIKSELFQNVFDDYNIECIIPSDPSQKKVMHIIYDNVKAGLPIEKNLFDEVKAELMENGAQVIILGCTELSMVKRDFETSGDVLDIMEVIARTAVRSCAKLKEEYIHLIKVK